MPENIFVIGFNFLKEVSSIHERINYYSKYKNILGFGVFEGFGLNKKVRSQL